MNILCKLGMHNWSQWQFLGHLFEGSGFYRQKRSCKWCGYTKVKEKYV